MRRALLLAALLLLPALLPLSASAQELDGAQEPTAKFRMSHDNHGTATGGAPWTADVLWEYETDSAVMSSPVVAEGMVYFGTMNGDALCLDAYTGSLIWEREVGEAIESSPAVMERDRVYIGSDDGNLYCLYPDNGVIDWTATTGDAIKCSPAVAHGSVFVGSYDNDLHCFDADSGEELWNVTTGGWVHSSPAVRDGRVYFGSCDGLLYCVNASDGEVLWTFEAQYIPASPAVTEDVVVIGSNDDNLYYLDPGTGDEIKNFSEATTGIHSSASVVDPGEGLLPIVYFGDMNGTFFGLDSDGELAWSVDLGASISSSPAVATGFRNGTSRFVVVGTEGGVLHGIEDPTTVPGGEDQVRWSRELGLTIMSSPFLYHEKVYVGAATEDGGGLVVCIGRLDPDTDIAMVIDWNWMVDPFIVWNTSIDVRTYGFTPDAVEVVLGADVYQTQHTEISTGHDLWSVEATPTLPEGLREVTLRALVDGEVIKETTSEVAVLIEGSGGVEVIIDEPVPGSRIDGVFKVSGRVRSNFTVLEVAVSWDDTGDWIEVEGFEDWSIHLDTHGLPDGNHRLEIYAFDGYRWGRSSIEVKVGEERPGVGWPDAVAVIVLIALFAALLATTPSRKE